VRHVKVKGDASPYDGNLVYWSTRMGKNPEMPSRESSLLKRQKGKCAHCGLYFTEESVLEVDHAIPKSKDGKNSYDNLQLLHRHCHDKKTANDGSSGIKSGCNSAKPKPTIKAKSLGNRGTRDKSLITEEPDEAKVSRPVLKTSGTREVSLSLPLTRVPALLCVTFVSRPVFLALKSVATSCYSAKQSLAYC